MANYWYIRYKWIYKTPNIPRHSLPFLTISPTFSYNLSPCPRQTSQDYPPPSLLIYIAPLITLEQPLSSETETPYTLHPTLYIYIIINNSGTPASQRDRTAVCPRSQYKYITISNSSTSASYQNCSSGRTTGRYYARNGFYHEGIGPLVRIS
jgi:hypothetical protein